MNYYRLYSSTVMQLNEFGGDKLLNTFLCVHFEIKVKT
jgi:hypothetical protein